MPKIAKDRAYLAKNEYEIVNSRRQVVTDECRERGSVWHSSGPGSFSSDKFRARRMRWVW